MPPDSCFIMGEGGEGAAAAAGAAEAHPPLKVSVSWRNPQDDLRFQNSGEGITGLGKALTFTVKSTAFQDMGYRESLERPAGDGSCLLPMGWTSVSVS